MGVQEKHEVDCTKEWVIAGMSLTAIKTISSEKRDDYFEEDDMVKTPVKEKEVRTAERFVCPPAPKKRKPSLICRLDGIEFFATPADLETVFVRREIAK